MRLYLHICGGGWCYQLSIKLLLALWNNLYVTFIFRTLGWYSVNEIDHQVYFPTLQINEAKSVSRIRRYGPHDEDYFWFLYPHRFEYQQTLKVEIYCDLDFTSFPFDSHECDLKFGASSSYSSSLILNEPRLRYKDQKREFGEGPLNFNPSRLAFNISLESLKEFEFSQAGYKYSFTGMRITMTRNNYGLLIGGYYGPTIIFSLLSLVSFSINPDIVSLTVGSIHEFAQFKILFLNND